MGTVTSRDGTTIAFDQTGQGPAVVLVDGALCYRAFGPMPALAAALASRFTVFSYDRRGRGDSGDTPPFSVDREIEDLDAVIGAAGGSASVYAISSGAALALAAAAGGLAITKLALYEPPFVADGTSNAEWLDFRARLDASLAAGRRGDAVASFMTLVGSPPAAVEGMRRAPVWPVFEAVAPTLAYDAAAQGDGRVPRELAAKVVVPTLVAAGGASPEALAAPARALADAIPGARFAVVPEQTHDVKPEALAPVLIDFLR